MNRLKELRLEKGLLQSDIARIIGKGSRIIGFYETGERDMGTKTLTILANFFNVSIDYLLGKTDIKNIESNIKKEYEFAYHKETEGLTEKEIIEAVQFYKKIKYGNNKED